MEEKYLSSFADQESALSYTGGGETLISPQVSLIEGDTELVYSKEIPHGSKMKFERDETTGKLYFVVDGVYFTVNGLFPISVPQVNYNAIDLGLPNGTIWADRNVGASSPSDYGSYFSWGNVEGVTRCNGVSMSDNEVLTLYMALQGVPSEMIPSYIEEFKQQEGWENEIDKESSQISINDVVGYSFDSDTYATTSGGQYTGSTLDAEHDAATANMGSDWRMPTSAETLELVQGTDHYYIGEDGSIVAGPFNYETNPSDKGLDGSKLRSICFVKKDATFNYNDRSNFIEFPFAGVCNGSLLDVDGLGGSVWSSSVRESNVEYARSLGFNSDGYLYGDLNSYRCNGRSVRGVLG